MGRAPASGRSTGSGRLEITVWLFMASARAARAGRLPAGPQSTRLLGGHECEQRQRPRGPSVRPGRRQRGGRPRARRALPSLSAHEHLEKHVPGKPGRPRPQPQPPAREASPQSSYRPHPPEARLAQAQLRGKQGAIPLKRHQERWACLSLWKAGAPPQTARPKPGCPPPSLDPLPVTVCSPLANHPAACAGHPVQLHAQVSAPPCHPQSNLSSLRGTGVWARVARRCPYEQRPRRLHLPRLRKGGPSGWHQPHPPQPSSLLARSPHAPQKCPASPPEGAPLTPGRCSPSTPEASGRSGALPPRPHPCIPADTRLPLGAPAATAGWPPRTEGSGPSHCECGPSGGDHQAGSPVRPCAGPPLAAPQLGSDSLRVTCDGSAPRSPSPPAPADGSPAPPAGLLQAGASARVGHSPCPALPALSGTRSCSYRPPASRNLAPQSVHTILRPLSTRSPRF